MHCYGSLRSVLAGNAATDVVAYSTGRGIGFMFLIGFTGIFAVTALRKIFIIDYKLAYPSGTATGILINSLHTPSGEKRVGHCLQLPLLSLCQRSQRQSASWSRDCQRVQWSLVSCPLVIAVFHLAVHCTPRICKALRAHNLLTAPLECPV